MLNDITGVVYSNITTIETMGIAFILGLIVSFTYMITADKEDYNRSLCYTLVIVPVVAAVVIM